LRVSPYWPFLLVFVLPALPLVVAVSGGLLGDWTGAEDEDEDELDGVVVVELSDGGVADELPLIELLLEGVVLLVEPGVDVLLDEELGVLMSVVDEVVDEDEGVVEVELLLRSQPVTAAVATASTATRGMSLFMNSFSIRNGGDVGRSLTGPGGRCVQHSSPPHNACQASYLGNGSDDAESGRETCRPGCNPFRS
jgi:hypothetical protein